jgi:type VI secretion system protein ImpE
MSEITILGTSLSAAMARVKSAPADPSLRFGLFRMFAFTGQWSRAATQLATGIQMDATQAMYGTTYHPCLNCEGLREQVFSGTDKSPVFLGEPERWQGLLLQALRVPEVAEREALMLAALGDAPEVAGTFGDTTFSSVCDADHRFGPQVELFVDGKYYWVGLDRLEEIRFLERTDLIDHLWLPVEIVLKGGGSKSGYIPARYPGSQGSADSEIVLGKTTEFHDFGDELQTATGGRQWVFDEQALMLSQVPTIIIGPSEGNS